MLGRVSRSDKSFPIGVNNEHWTRTKHGLTMVIVITILGESVSPQIKKLDWVTAKLLLKRLTG